MKYIQCDTLSNLESKNFDAKFVLFATDIPKVIIPDWEGTTEYDTKYSIDYNTETDATTLNEIVEE